METEIHVLRNLPENHWFNSFYRNLSPKPLFPRLKSYGFSSVEYQNYNYSKEKQKLNNGNPVILTAYSKNVKDCKSWVPSWLCFNKTYNGGHVWICDGYISSYYCSTGNSYLKFHMNWGLSGQYNGFYNYNGKWELGNTGGSYNFDRKMIYNFN